ncbi:cytochrome c family protein [Bradyrhizobium sp. CCGUVB14]|uniref:c-type cytochrome n=1 Tax=Bradyrhizobium sp. CCGUVB14 TaxID=2949628 RepID=UPI0020B421FD|nr:c-type cytochrome [Bradyrhizobium sp. CCGUVB14]MCP3442284.1 cytochrome C [Bradyrhizobium sp. CCGUVB14]
MPFTHSNGSIFLVIAAGALTASAVVGGVAQGYLKQTETTARAMTAGDPARAPALIRRYGCAGCHTISGIPGGDGQVGSSLADIRQRVYIAGVMTNTPDNLIRWLVTPQTFSPRSAMPATGISEAEAREVAAYLYAH